MNEVPDEEAASLRGGVKQIHSIKVNVVKHGHGPARWSVVQDDNGKVTRRSGTGNLSINQRQVSGDSESINSVYISFGSDESDD